MRRIFSRIKYILPVTAVLLVVFICCAPFVSYAKSAPPVDPETVRRYTYSGSPKVGLWLNSFDEEGNCIGNTYAIFKAGASFNQFGFPVVWAGREENGADAEYRVAIYAYDESPEKSFESEPLFNETIHQNGDNGYGGIFPMPEPIPAGTYILSTSQTTPRTGDPKPYIVIPTGTPALGSAYVEYGGTPGGMMCFFVDFIKEEGVTDYFLPIKAGHSFTINTDDPVMVLESTTTEARRLSEGETLAVLTDTIPREKVLTNLTFSSFPTWGNNGPGSNLYYEVFEWKKDYKNTVAGEPLITGEVVNHMDNAPVDLAFGAFALPGGTRYLIVTRSSGTAAIGFWKCTGEIRVDKPGWQIYMNGKVTETERPEYSYTTATATYLEIPEETPSPTTESASSATNPPRQDQTPAPSNANTGCGSALSSPLIAVMFVGLSLCLIPRTKGKKR